LNRKAEDRSEVATVSLKFIKPERVSLANHPEYREKWVQDRIAEDPSILGLGDLVLKPGSLRTNVIKQSKTSNT
jgi:hypothetical protein